MTRSGRWKTSPPGRLAESAARVSLVLLALTAVIILVLHVVRRDLDWASRYMSEYSLGAHGGAMLLVFVLLGAASVLLAFAIPLALDPARLVAPVAGFLAAWGAGMALLAVYPWGGVHDGVLRAAELFLVAAAAALMLVRRGGGSWRGFVPFTCAMGAMALTAFLLVDARGLREWVGLSQRVAALAAVAWLASVALLVIEAARRRGAEEAAWSRDRDGEETSIQDDFLSSARALREDPPR